MDSLLRIKAEKNVLIVRGSYDAPGFEACVKEEMSVLNKQRTHPPSKYTRHPHHWLFSERASYPCVSEWLKGEWHSAGESKPIDIYEMYRRGWRWYGPAYPPKTAYSGSVFFGKRDLFR